MHRPNPNKEAINLAQCLQRLIQEGQAGVVFTQLRAIEPPRDKPESHRMVEVTIRLRGPSLEDVVCKN